MRIPTAVGLESTKVELEILDTCFNTLLANVRRSLKTLQEVRR